MYKQARQWPFNMTAGLQPVQLVHNYQHGQLTLKFNIKHELHDGLIEPLMTQTVWKNGMGGVKQVAYKKHIWSISGLTSVVIEYDKEQKEIKVFVTFREDAERMGVTNRIFAEVFGEDLPDETTVINSSELAFSFSDDKPARSCG